jgi:hypothetical protein
MQRSRTWLLLAVLAALVGYVGVLDSSRAEFTARREFEVTQKGTVLLPAGAREAEVRIPLASTRRGQKVLSRKLVLSGGAPYVIRRDAAGNETAHVRLEGPLPEKLRLLVTYHVRTEAAPRGPRLAAGLEIPDGEKGPVPAPRLWAPDEAGAASVNRFFVRVGRDAGPALVEPVAEVDGVRTAAAVSTFRYRDLT